MTERMREDVETFFNEIHQEDSTQVSLVNNTQIASEEDGQVNIEVLGETNELSIEESRSVNLIPENSLTGFIKENDARFSGALWYYKMQTKSVILAGIGGIGSWVAFLLSRMNVGFITLYDPDTVEAVNMSGQLYGEDSIDKAKVNAISDFIKTYSRYHQITAIAEKYTYNNAAGDIMICGFDSMESRRIYFNKWKIHISKVANNYKQNCLYIDGRLSAETLQVFCIKGDDEYNINLYENLYLFKSSEADLTICSYKQTTFMANMIGSIIVNLFTNFVANQCNPLIDRELPFFTEYSAETMYLNIIK